MLTIRFNSTLSTNQDVKAINGVSYLTNPNWDTLLSTIAKYNLKQANTIVVYLKNLDDTKMIAVLRNTIKIVQVNLGYKIDLLDTNSVVINDVQVNAYKNGIVIDAKRRIELNKTINSYNSYKQDAKVIDLFTKEVLKQAI